VEIQVPPLRARREDVGELAQFFLSRHRETRELALSTPASDALRHYSWPGNVRELQRLIERAVALTESGTIELDDLPAHVRGEYTEVLGPALASDESMRAWGSRYARLVFERCGRNKRRACALLDISYHTLQAYLRFASRDGSGSAKQVPAWARLPEDDAAAGARKE
jgi:DNA-binding NtrC family response regulator